MTEKQKEEFNLPKECWPLTTGDTAKKLAEALGETPHSWQIRLSNWRRSGRASALQHYQNPGKWPYYRSDDVEAFIQSRLKSRAVLTGKSPQLADAKALASEHGIVLEWSSSAAFGRVRLSIKTARTLAAQLVGLADRYESQVSDDTDEQQS